MIIQPGTVIGRQIRLQNRGEGINSAHIVFDNGECGMRAGVNSGGCGEW